MSSTHLIDQALDFYRSCMVENLLGSCTDLFCFCLVTHFEERFSEF